MRPMTQGRLGQVMYTVMGQGLPTGQLAGTWRDMVTAPMSRRSSQNSSRGSRISSPVMAARKGLPDQKASPAAMTTAAA